MRKIIFALLVVAFAFAAAGTGGASTRSPQAASTALVKCGKSRTIGFMAPVTGPASDIGSEQVAWAKYFVSTYNKTHKNKLKLQTEDTQLGAATGTAEALKGAQALASNASVLALAGPAGGNEIVGVTKRPEGAGLAWVSGSAPRPAADAGRAPPGCPFPTRAPR